MSRGVSGRKVTRRGLGVELLPRRSEEAEPGDDLVRAPRELLEHPLGLARACRLAVDPAVDDDGGVDSEHRALACDAGDGVRFSARMSLHKRYGV